MYYLIIIERSKVFFKLFVGLCLSKLIEGPKSASALIGEVSSFNCSGIGVVFWIVNGNEGGHDSLSDKGISSKLTTTSSGSTLSQLSVPAIPENNNISISCLVVDDVSVETSAIAVLTVLGKEHFCWF